MWIVAEKYNVPRSTMLSWENQWLATEVLDPSWDVFALSNLYQPETTCTAGA